MKVYYHKNLKEFLFLTENAEQLQKTNPDNTSIFLEKLYGSEIIEVTRALCVECLDNEGIYGNRN